MMPVASTPHLAVQTSYKEGYQKVYTDKSIIPDSLHSLHRCVSGYSLFC